MENYSTINIATLSRVYREAEMSSRGFNTISELSPKSDEPLKKLLRHHDEGTVYEEELYQRFDIDSLIQYYALLEVAIIAGYIDPQLSPALKQEVIQVLNDTWVRKYYEENYPYFLPSILRYSLKLNVHYVAEQPDLSRRLFNDFLLLNRTVENDEDVSCFLKMLDFVSFGGEDLDTLIKMLNSPEELNEALMTKTSSPGKEMALWGFLKYSDFLVRLKTIMIAAEQVPLLQSAIWEYHSYWFRILAKEMKDFFNKAYDNLTEAIRQTERPDVFLEIDESEDSTPESEFFLHQQKMIDSVDTARQAISYLLETNFSKPLTNYYIGLITEVGIEDPIPALPKIIVKKRDRGSNNTGEKV